MGTSDLQISFEVRTYTPEPMPYGRPQRWTMPGYGNSSRPTVRRSPSKREIREEWTPIDEVIARPDSLVDGYLSLESVNCCRLLGGYFVTVGDDLVVHGGGHLWMFYRWFFGLLDLCLGKVWHAEVEIDDQWSIYLSLDDDELTVRDEGCATVPFQSFLVEALREGGKFMHLARLVHAEVERRLEDESDPEQVKDLKEIAFNYVLEEEHLERLTDAYERRFLGKYELS